MHSFHEILEIVNATIAQISFEKEPKALYEPMQYTLSLGGKRIRPVLVLMGSEMFGGTIKDALHAAIGIEYLHNFTLIHDDIMDNAPIRRGKETVYKKWNQNIAILSGDALFAIALKQITDSDTPNKTEVIKEFLDATIKICEGQQYDMDFETQRNVSINEYIEMIRLKTSVLLGSALKMGGLIAGTNESNNSLLYDIGVNLGLAFQLKDDWLDIYGNQEKFGKQTGNDIITNKKTYLYIKAYELANEKQIKILDNAFLTNNLSDKEKINTVKEIYDQLGIDKITQSDIEQYYRIAEANLSKIPIDERSKQPLLELIRFLIERDY